MAPGPSARGSSDRRARTRSPLQLGSATLDVGASAPWPARARSANLLPRASHCLEPLHEFRELSDARGFRITGRIWISSYTEPMERRSLPRERNRACRFQHGELPGAHLSILENLITAPGARSGASPLFARDAERHNSCCSSVIPGSFSRSVRPLSLGAGRRRRTMRQVPVEAASIEASVVLPRPLVATRRT